MQSSLHLESSIFQVYEISVSLEETVDRMNTNKRKYNEQCSQNLTRLIHNLYDKNKENLEVHRRDRSRSVDSAEVSTFLSVILKSVKGSPIESAGVLKSPWLTLV